MNKITISIIIFTLLLGSFSLSMAADNPIESGITCLEKNNYPGSMASFTRALKAAQKAGDKEGQAEAHLWLAHYYLKTNFIDLSIQHAIESKKIYESSGEDWRILEANTALISGLLAREKREDMTLYFDGRVCYWICPYLEEIRTLTVESEKIIVDEKVPASCLIDFLLQRGMFLLHEGKIEMADKNFQAGLLQARKEGDIKREIASLVKCAYLNGVRKIHKSAARYNAEAGELAYRHGEEYLQALIVENLGEIQSLAGNRQEALGTYLIAAKLFEAMGNQGKKGEALFTVARLYRALENSHQSSYYLKSSIAVFEQSANDFALLEAYWWYFDEFKWFKYNLENFKEDDEIQSIHQALERTIKTDSSLNRGLAYYYLACFYTEKDAYDTLYQYYQKAADLFLAGGWHQPAAKALYLKSLALFWEMKYEASLATLQKSLDIITLPEASSFYRQMPSNQFINEQHIYHLMGMAYRELENYKKSIEFLKKAYEHNLSEGNDYDGRRRRRILLYCSLINSSIAAYEADAARDYIDKALQLVSSLDDSELKGASYHYIISTIINSCYRKGYRVEISAARNFLLAHLMEAVMDNPSIYGDIKTSYLKTISGAEKSSSADKELQSREFYGLFNCLSGNYPEALNQFSMAIEILEDYDFLKYRGGAFEYLADLYVSRQAEAEALEVLKKSFAYHKKANFPYHQFLDLIRMCSIQGSLGNYQGALENCKHAEAILLSLPEGDSHYAHFLNQLTFEKGSIYSRMGRLPEALDNFNRSLKNNREDNLFKARILLNIGRLKQRQGQVDEAIECLRKTLSIVENYQDYEKMLEITIELGELLESGQHFEDAEKIYVSTIDLILEKWSAIRTSRSAHPAENRQLFLLFKKAINLLLKNEKFENALQYLELSSSAELCNSLDFDGLDIKDEELKAFLQNISTLRKKMSLIEQEIKGDVDADRRETLNRILATTREEFFRTVNEIKSNNPDFEQLLAVRPTDLTEIKKIIPPDTILIQFYPARDALYIFLLTADSFEIRTIEITRNRFYTLLKEYRNMLTTVPDSSLKEEFKATGALLSDILVTPIEDSLKDRKKILLVPGGLLWYIPFETLRRGNSYTIENRPISYLTSGDVLKLIQKKEVPPKEQLKFIGFGSPPGVDLPFTGKELERFSRTFDNSEIYLGSQATKNRFLASIDKYDLIHIATHGSLDREDINNSSIEFAGEDNKLLLGEIYGITLKPSSMVILSSCESALGEENPGREFTSLASAFSTAGASSVIASMWDVDDEATFMLFSEFYKNLKSGRTRAESLRRAKIALIKNPTTSHPFYWGGFVLLGDWR